MQKNPLLIDDFMNETSDKFVFLLSTHMYKRDLPLVMYSLLHLEWYFFILKSQSMI